MRDASGALKHGVKQAQSRAEVLQHIKAQGGIPVTVVEGGRPGTAVPWHFLTTWGARIGLALGVLALVWSLVVKLKPFESRTAQSKADVRDGPAGGFEKTSATTPEQQGEGTEGQVGAMDTTPARAQPEPSKEASKTARDTGHEAPPEVPVKPAKRPAPFRTMTEQALAMIASIPPGVPIPPMPEMTGMDVDYARARTNILEIGDDDSEKLVSMIETVAWDKVDLEDLVKQGWKPDEVLKAMVANHNQEANLRTAAALALKNILDQVGVTPAAFNEELELINAELEERGLPVITLGELGIREE